MSLRKVGLPRLKTLFLHPVNVFRKYSFILVHYWILKEPKQPYLQENYDRHWNYTSFKNKAILDFGADRGSTAVYFHRKGASKVICVEGDHGFARDLLNNARRFDFIIPYERMLESAQDFSVFINTFNPDIVKVDVEGAERHLLECPDVVLKGVPEFLIETHSKEIYENSLSRFLSIGFQIHRVRIDMNRSELNVLVLRSRRSRKKNE